MTGSVVWVTGLPSAGKSTFAERALQRLRECGVSACLLDGDEVRKSLVPAPGYSSEERGYFYETLARLAALLARQGLVVLVPATAHRRSLRERARELAPHYVEVFVATPLEECVKRDSKGLYAASRRGSAEGVPGAGETYEPPLAPDVVAAGGGDLRAVSELMERISDCVCSTRRNICAPQ